MGISRVDLTVPISSFHHISGLRGNILSTAKFNGTLYVGTSDGLYKLNESQNYSTKTIEYTTKKPIVKKVKQTVQTQSVEQPVTERKKGLFSRIFGGERTEQATNEQNNVQTVEVDQVEYSKTVVKENERKLISANFIYQKIEGISGKINSVQAWIIIF
jgi:hypothetical protein